MIHDAQGQPLMGATAAAARHYDEAVRAYALAYGDTLGALDAALREAPNLTMAVLFKVTCFDCLHDMGDPAGAAAHIRRSLKKDGTWMIVEPMAGDKLEQNINPVGRLYYAASTMICVPTSLSQEVGTALGAQAGEAKLREIIQKGGFSSVRRATETPFNMILEGRL